MKKGFYVVVMMLTAIFLLAACQSKESSTKPPKAPQTKPEPIVQPKKPAKPEKVYPLTGLPAGDDAINRRVVAVMVNNHHKARPQSGLPKADIVYEALTEGRITRFLAVYQSQKPNVIGPIRSARPYFIELSNGFDAIYVAHGWSKQAQSILLGGGTDYIQGLYHDGTWFHRASFRKAPHNSYIPYKNVVKGAKTKGYKFTQDVKPLPFLSKDEVDNISGEPVNKVTIQYATNNIVGYDYHSDDGLYYRHINGKQSADRETKTPITAANVFIVSADHRFIDSYPRRAIDLKKGGPAYLLQKGKLQKIQWKNVDGRILPYKNGEPLSFVPGKTWVNIIESDPGLDGIVKIVN